MSSFTDHLTRSVRVLLAAALVAATTVVLPATHEAADASAAQERLVFTRDVGSGTPDWDLWIIDLATSDEAALTTGSGHDYASAFSPDGSKVAFTRGSTTDGTGTADLYVIEADGSDLTKIVGDGSYNGAPAWSPDGQQLVFESDRDGDKDLYVVNADGTGEVVPVANVNNGVDDFAPDWSPDGTRIAFTRDDGGQRDLWYYTVASGGETPVTNRAALDRSPKFSPDGTELLFFSDLDGNLDVRIVSLDGLSERAVTTHAADEVFARWSPDGAKVTFTSDRATGNDDIWMIDATGEPNGATPTNFTIENASDDFGADWGETTAAMPISCPLNAVTWDGGGGTTAWGTAANWGGDTLPDATTDTCIRGDVVVEAPGVHPVKTLTLAPDETGAVPTLRVVPGFYDRWVVAEEGIVNAGTIDLTHGYNPTLKVTSGALVNTGTITVDDEAPHFMTAYLDVPDLQNEGLIAIGPDALNLRLAGSSVTNAGSITIVEGGALTVEAGQGIGFAHVEGAHLDAGVTIRQGNTFVYAGGTVDGTITIQNATLSFTEGAAVPDDTTASFEMSQSGTLDGDVPQNAIVRIVPTFYEQVVTAADSFTNAGTIELSTSHGTFHPTLRLTTGTLVNTGTVSVPASAASHGVLDAPAIENDGRIEVGVEELQLMHASGTFTNRGSFSVASGGLLRVPADTGLTFLHEAGADLDPGVLVQRGNTFVYGGGALDGTVTLEDSMLSFTEGAAVPADTNPVFDLVSNGALSGDVPSGAGVRIIPTWYEQVVTAAAGFTNAGTIEFSTTHGTFAPTLAVSSGTLTNTGTIAVPSSQATHAVLDVATLDNEGSVALSRRLDVTGTLANLSGGSLTGGSYDLAAALRLSPATLDTWAADVILRPGGSIVSSTDDSPLVSGTGTVAESGSLTLADGVDLAVTALTNEGAIQIGADSSLTLSGTYTQPGGGTLTLADPSAALSATHVVVDGGALGGTGVVAADVTVDGGAIAPGASPGTLIIDGDLTVTASGTLVMEIDGATAGTEHDQLQVTGSAALAGTLEITTAESFVPGAGDEFLLVPVAVAATDNGIGTTGTPGTGLGYAPTVTEHGLSVVVAAVPGAPTSVDVTPGPASVGLTWAAPADDGGSPVTGYRVTVSPGDHVLDVGSTEATVTGLTDGTSYTFRVNALNTLGASALSDPVVATPRTVPGAPTSVTASAGNAQATVSWAAPSNDGGAAVTGYTVTASPGGHTASSTGTATSVTVTGLINGTAYTFTVVATNAAGDGATSAASAAVTPAAPASSSPTPSRPGPSPSPTPTPTPAPGAPATTSTTTTVAPGGTATAESGRVSIRVPGGGDVTITETVHHGEDLPEAPAGFDSLGYELSIEAPESGDEPLVIEVAPPTTDTVATERIVVLFNDARVAPCAVPGQLGPDPCYSTTVAAQGKASRSQSTGSYALLTTKGGTFAFAAVEPACDSDIVTASGFTDLAGSVHRDAVECAVGWGLTGGVSGDTYRPARVVTRGQMASFLVRAMRLLDLEVPKATHSFSDVRASSVHAGDIASIAAVGIVVGKDGRTYGPHKPVTRQQAATMLVRVYELARGDALPEDRDWFQDDDGSPHESSINRASSAGLTLGVSPGRFEPAAGIRRDQMASLLTRFVDRAIVDGHLGPR